MRDLIPNLPTPLALVARRLEATGQHSSADTFLVTSYLIEATIKTITAILVGAVDQQSPQHAYSAGFELVRADGLGTWTDVIGRLSSSSCGGLLPPQFLPISKWLNRKRTKPEDNWFREGLSKIDALYTSMGQEAPTKDRPLTVLAMLAHCVVIRNKTKAHGAFGPDFFSQANPAYIDLARIILANSPLSAYPLAYVSAAARPHQTWRLTGPVPCQVQFPASPSDGPLAGIYVFGGAGSPAFLRLLRSNREMNTFFFPNGGWSDKQQTCECIDYASGHATAQEYRCFARVPAPLPKSETHGQDTLDIHSNVFGNLPEVCPWYVSRRNLEKSLMERLLDRNHAIITLHGIGGIGKTSLALWAAYQLANRAEPPFGRILWFSARDLDLRQSGPARVAPAVATLEDAARVYGRLFATGKEVTDFAVALESQDTEGPTLFIFDNFETIAEPRALHEFLDNHTIVPNKVLITSRERAFKGDYPIEVRGMEWPEAEVVLIQAGRRFHCEGMLDANTKRRMWEDSGGHPYVMQVLVGEMSAIGRYQPPPTLLGRRTDVLDALFERSFTMLTPDARWCFLIISNWRSAVAATCLYAVGLRSGKDIDGGIEQCLRLSLINELESVDGQPCYEAPEMARIFGKRKLLSDPDRPMIQRDLDIVRSFGVIEKGAKHTPVTSALMSYYQKALKKAGTETLEEAGQTDDILRRIAEHWPEGWRYLARYRMKAGRGREAVEYAARRAVEASPNDVEIWKERAEYARQFGDQETEMACWVSAVEAQPSNVSLVCDVANRLNNFIGSIPKERRSYYLASVRARMERLAHKLDATGRSRLAWLYLHEENTKKAKEHVEAGLKIDANNTHCLRLYERLQKSNE